MDARPKKQYPDDWQPPLRGTCQWPIRYYGPGVIHDPKCGYETRGFTKTWLGLCPFHWQKL